MLLCTLTLYVQTTLHAMTVGEWLGRLSVTAYRTRYVAPFDQATGMKSVIAEYREYPVDALVHSFQADGARRQFRVSGEGHPVVSDLDSRNEHHVADDVGL